MSLADRSSMITVFMASVAAMLTPPNPCPALGQHRSCAARLGSQPVEMVRPCSARGHQSCALALPFSKLTATLSPAQFNSP
jgi:hypothetical protein